MINYDRQIDIKNTQLKRKKKNRRSEPKIKWFINRKMPQKKLKNNKQLHIQKSHNRNHIGSGTERRIKRERDWKNAKKNDDEEEEN